MRKTNVRFIIVIIALILFVSSCANVEVSQKLYRNGNVDMVFNIYSRHDDAQKILKTPLNISTDTASKYTFEITDEGSKHIFNNLNLEDDKLLDPTNNSEYNLEIFNIDTYSLEKEFRFPYYYYTYSIRNPYPNWDEVTERALKGEDFKDLTSRFSEPSLSSYVIVEVFGEIVETEGNITGQNIVEFEVDILYDNPEFYEIKFRDLFWNSWFKK